MKKELTGHNVTATIDGYTPTESQKIWRIIKAETFLINNEDLNTPLSNNVLVNATLYYIDDDGEQQKIKKGAVFIKVTDLSNNVIFDSKTVSIQNGDIQCQLTNKLPIGDYFLTIEYYGTKYYAPTTLTIKFAVEQRSAVCIFDQTLIQGYPNEKVTIDISLIDKINNKKIPNCTINYAFNGFQYVTNTNDQGRATLQVFMPNIDSYACPQRIEDITTETTQETELESNVHYFDYNGHIKTLYLPDDSRTEFTADGAASEITYQYEGIDPDYENTETFFEDYQLIPHFPLTISINDDVYKIDGISNIDVLNKRYNTSISHSITMKDGVAHIDGRVTAKDSNNNNHIVEYGKISFNVDEFGSTPYKQVLVDDDGYFEFDVDLSRTENANISNTLPITSFHQMYDTKTEINILNESLSNDNRTRLSRSYLNKHRMRFMATVTSDKVTVQYGMVTFIITENTNEVYRYVTEVDNDGKAYFNFNVSKIGEFKIKAKYHSIFEFKSSQSDIKDYIIIEESEE